MGGGDIAPPTTFFEKYQKLTNLRTPDFLTFNIYMLATLRQKIVKNGRSGVELQPIRRLRLERNLVLSDL